MRKIYEEFHTWLNANLSGELPADIQGFAINLYESTDTFDAELIGTSSFDENDEDWACDDIFMSKRFEFPRGIFKGDWESALLDIAESVRAFLEGGSNGAKILKSAKGIGVGFVDGNLVLVSKNS